jgi:hypothetical protein
MKMLAFKVNVLHHFVLIENEKVIRDKQYNLLSNFRFIIWLYWLLSSFESCNSLNPVKYASCLQLSVLRTFSLMYQKIECKTDDSFDDNSILC